MYGTIETDLSVLTEIKTSFPGNHVKNIDRI